MIGDTPLGFDMNLKASRSAVMVREFFLRGLLLKLMLVLVQFVEVLFVRC